MELEILEQPAQTTAESSEKEAAAYSAIAGGGEEGGNVSAENDGTDAEFSEGKPECDDGRTAEKPEERNRERDRRQAAKRREKEIREKIDAAKLEGAISVIGKNPWTGEALKTQGDLDDYLRMKAVADEGGDPLGADYVRAIRAEQKAAHEREEAEKKREEFVKADREAFSEAYPDVNLADLFGDPSFKDYADGKLGLRPLKDVYEGYRRLTAGFEEKAKLKVETLVANAKATPGSVSGQGSVETDVYTLEQLRNVTDTDVRKNPEKYERSLKYHHIN